MTVNIVENIRRIGIFMIAAQTVMHFTAGKQYEKYMKVITGVIILLMFINPFVLVFPFSAVNWQAEIERMEQQMQNSMWQEVPYATNSVEAVALQQIEEEIKTRLNEVIFEHDCRVTGVMIDLEEVDENSDIVTGEKNRGWTFQRIKVTLQSDIDSDFTDEHTDGTIRIEKITIGHELEADMEQEKKQNLNQDMKIREYQYIFAQTLGIAEDKVEVTYHGGW